VFSFVSVCAKLDAMKRFLFFLIVALCALPAPESKADTRNLITQSTPSDCGPAALATLLAFYLGIPTSESEMVDLTQSDPRRGTTFLQLQQAAELKGCEADSFRMTYDTLRRQMKEFPSPVLVRLLGPEPHFAVVLEAGEKEVCLADPAHGNIILSRGAFLQRWLIRGAPQGFVFIAIAPDEFVNRDLQARVVRELKKSQRALKSPFGAPSTSLMLRR